MVSKYVEYKGQVYKAIVAPSEQFCSGCAFENGCIDVPDSVISCNDSSLPAGKTLIYKKVKPEEIVEINII